MVDKKKLDKKKLVDLQEVLRVQKWTRKKKYRKYFKTHTHKTTTFEYLEIITFIANSYLNFTVLKA